jgi:hypothetical protein
MQLSLLVELLRHYFVVERVAVRWCLYRPLGRLLSVTLRKGHTFLGDFSEC